MILKNISYEKINTTVDGVYYDIDVYHVEFRSSLATHEYTINVDHVKKNVYGDVIRYGEWGNLDKDEVVKILEMVDKEGKLKRSFIDYI